MHKYIVYTSHIVFDLQPFTITRAELRRFITVAEFFCQFAGLPDPRLVREFDSLRPEFQAALERFKSQAGKA